jgi:16S rRNA (guanine527-N7)-methyltransferase
VNSLENIRDICNKNNLTISDQQLNMLDRYVRILCEWNEKINLLSRKDIDNIWTRHIIGSLAFLFEYSFTEKCTIADVGTGGGLPGIPLAIMLPECKVTLIDSIRKKITAVSDMLHSLALENVTTLHGRAEELSRKPKYQNSFDYVIARAVGPIHDVVGWSYGFLKHQKPSAVISGKQGGQSLLSPGSIILIKGGDLTDEISRTMIDYKKWQIETRPMKVKNLPIEDLQDKKFVFVREGKNK